MQEWQAACSLPPSERCQANTASVWHRAAVSAARGETLGSCEGETLGNCPIFSDLVWFAAHLLRALQHSDQNKKDRSAEI